jgi:hypothetical protein
LPGAPANGGFFGIPMPHFAIHAVLGLTVPGLPWVI